MHHWKKDRFLKTRKIFDFFDGLEKKNLNIIFTASSVNIACWTTIIKILFFSPLAFPQKNQVKGHNISVENHEMFHLNIEHLIRINQFAPLLFIDWQSFQHICLSHWSALTRNLPVWRRKYSWENRRKNDTLVFHSSTICFEKIAPLKVIVRFWWGWKCSEKIDANYCIKNVSAFWIICMSSLVILIGSRRKSQIFQALQ